MLFNWLSKYRDISNHMKSYPIYVYSLTKCDRKVKLRKS